MGWGQNTPTQVCDSTQDGKRILTRLLSASGLGILMVFCLPSAISKASYTSERPTVIADVLPAAASPNLLTKLAGGNVYEEPQTPIEAQGFKAEPTRNDKEPVQLASLDVDIPQIAKPNDFLPKTSIAPPTNQVIRPRLEKKLFGTVELRFDDERKIKAWSSVYYKFEADTRTIKSCLNAQENCADPVFTEWAHKLKPLQNLSTFQKITAVNAIANQYPYSDDRRNYGKSDYWAGPREFLTRGGDCEDYALLKFASLIALGVDEDDMRLVVGRLSDGTPHAFLAANVDQREYILDNRQSSIYLTSNRRDYIPKYSMNLTHRWSHVVPRAATRT